MTVNELLLFTTGRRSRLFDPRTSLSYGRSNNHIDFDDDDDDLSDGDVTIPEIKNADCYSSRNGEVYLLGGKWYLIKEKLLGLFGRDILLQKDDERMSSLQNNPDVFVDFNQYFICLFLLKAMFVVTNQIVCLIFFFSNNSIFRLN